MSDDVSRLDLDRLANGSVPSSPCAGCNKPTQSHVLIHTGDEWRLFDERSIVDELPAATTVRFAIACHSCVTDLPLPASRDVAVYAVEDTLDTDAQIEAVIA